MRSVFQFIVVNALFVAINVLAALILVALFKAGHFVSPDLMGSPFVAYALGILGVTLTIWGVWWWIRFINRSPGQRLR